MADLCETHATLLADLATGLAAGKQAVVVMVTTDADHVPTLLEMRSTKLSALSRAEVATYVLEQAIAQARRAGDGSADLPLVHLEDALRSLEAAAMSIGADATATVIGRA